MATVTATPIEEYLRTSYEPDMEYVDGELVERNVGEYFHSWLQALIAELLSRVGRQRKFRVFTEQRVKIGNEPIYRIPDLCLKALPHEPTPILERPDVAIEILSPDDRPADVLEKIGDYLRAGIPHIWIVDPYCRKVIQAGPDGIREATGHVVSSELTGEVDFTPLFAELEESGIQPYNERG